MQIKIFILMQVLFGKMLKSLKNYLEKGYRILLKLYGSIYQ